MAALPDRTVAAGPPVARLFVTESGEGRNVILLHGWTTDSHDWSWQLPALESRYRTIAVDLRGHGRSEVMPSGSYLPADYIERFCRQLTTPIYHLCRDQAQAERMRPWFSNPRAKVDVWKDAGHFIMQDRPDDVNAALTGWIDTL